MLDGSEVRETLLCVQELREAEDSLIVYAQEEVKASAQTFVNNKIGKLFRLATVYKDIFERLSLHTKDEFERRIKHHFRHSSLREAFEDWQETENEWDALLKDVDTQLDRGGPQPLTVGQQDEFHKLGAKIVMVSFGVREGAVRWLEETKCPFDMILDCDRQLYLSFGLKQSVLKVWSIPCMVYYAELMRAGRNLPAPYENVHDDPNQLGGDFIVARDGTVLLTYCSQTSTDRPSVNLLLDALHASVIFKSKESALP